MVKMESPQIINTYDLPVASNICNQILREVIKRPNYSLAHVIMERGNISLYHNHDSTTELYFILSGEGLLYMGNSVMHVKDKDYIEIKKKTGHNLKNIGAGELEHLVIATPQFNPQNVNLLNEENFYNPAELDKKRKKFEALDGAIVEELNSEKEREMLGLSFAFGALAQNRKAKIHHHNLSEEIYYVISGEGKIHLNGSQNHIQKGSLIFIPKTVKHGLENTSNKDLEILCIANPPYQEDDFVLD